MELGGGNNILYLRDITWWNTGFQEVELSGKEVKEGEKENRKDIKFLLLTGAYDFKI